MKKLPLRLLSALLLTLLLVFSAVSCSDTGAPAETTALPAGTTAPAADVTTEEVVTEVNALNVLGPKDLGGETVTLYDRFYSGEWCSDLFSEEISGELVPSAIAKRNFNIQTQYNFTFKQIKSGAQSYYKDVMTKLTAGNPEFDMLCTSFRDAAYLATDGYLLAINDINEIQMDRSWWNPFLSEQISIGNKNYYITGDITTIDNISVRCCYCNKDLLASIAPGTDVYKLVDDNQWTLEQMFALATLAGNDVGGDGILLPSADGFGLLAEATLGYQLLMGSDELVIDKDADDLPYIAIGEARPLEILDYLTQKISNDPAITTDSVVSDNFRQGRILFILAVLDRVKDFRGEDMEIGVLPLPKYNTDQERYCCYSDAYCPNAISFPYGVSDDRIRLAAFAAEALAVESVSVVTPEFYEVCMKTRYAKDVKTSEMLDIILNNYTIDLVDVYLTPWGFRTPVTNAISAGTSMSTVLKANEKSVNLKIKKTVDALLALDH